VLRDLSRDYSTLLSKIVERGVTRPPSTGGGSSAAAGGGANARPNSPPLGQGGSQQQSSGAKRADEESVLESLWRYDSKSVCALIATAVAALCWPDAQAAGKACIVCRAVAGLAETSHPELEGLVLTDMLRSAILSTVQVRWTLKVVVCLCRWRVQCVEFGALPEQCFP